MLLKSSLFEVSLLNKKFNPFAYTVFLCFGTIDCMFPYDVLPPCVLGRFLLPYVPRPVVSESKW